jgi:hypothetical protein
MVAGGGASVVYADTICDLGFASELANYGFLITELLFAISHEQ